MVFGASTLAKRTVETVVLNLDFRKLDDELLAMIAEEAETIIREVIEENVGSSFIGDLNIVITVDRGEDKVTFTVSIEFTAPKILEIDYESILEEASRKAFKAIEEWLKKNAGVQNKGNSAVTNGS